MTDAQKETLTKLVEYYRLAQWDEVTLNDDHGDAIDAALAEIDRLTQERDEAVNRINAHVEVLTSDLAACRKALANVRGKSELSWAETKYWLAANPGKIAAIVTPDVTYVIRIEPTVPFLTQEAITEWREQ